MALEPSKKDVSYQYGRLLAVYENVERDTYDKGEAREPLAMRLQNAFCRDPFETAFQLEKHITEAYFPKIKIKDAKYGRTRDFYRKLIGEIMEELSYFSNEVLKQPLLETYLLGYYLQRNELYKSNKQKNDQETED